MTLYVVVLVCAMGQPCDTRTARAYQAYRAPPGILVCGLPGMLPLQSAVMIPQDGEEQHVKCVVRP